MNGPRDNLLALPTAGVGHWPTPLHRLDRFTDALRERGADVEVWIKRDDIQGVALAGNKIRKFDLVLGQGLADGADTLVTTGAAQSNSARTGAAAARALGLEPILLLSGERPAEATGNLLLDDLLGADVRFAGDADWAELNAGVDAIVAEINAGGGRAVAAPIGCSSPLGSLGFARAFLELDAQLDAAGLSPTAVVHTTTSGGTHAGLLVGRSVSERDVRLVGVDAGLLFADPVAAVADLAAEAAALIGLDAPVTVDEVELVLDQVGPAYGAPTEAAVDAISLLARTEAIITDPVYSAKGLAGLIDGAVSGRLTGPIVFWHTGGYHALFDPDHARAVLGR